MSYHPSDGEDSMTGDDSHQPLITVRTSNGHRGLLSDPDKSPDGRGSSPPSSPSLWYLLSALMKHNRGLTGVLLTLLLVILPPYLTHLHYTQGTQHILKPANHSTNITVGLHSFHATDYLLPAAVPLLPNTTRDARSDTPTAAFIASTHIDRTHLVTPFAAIDAAFSSLNRWPRVDLLIRTFHGSAMFMPILFQSIELFWPRNIGRCLIVADAHSPRDEQVLGLAALVPTWCELHYETIPPEMIRNGRWTMQWSNFWTDNYTTTTGDSTTAQPHYVAIADTDSFFTHKVTPDMYFDKQNRIIHTVHPDFQRDFWDVDTLWWLGGKDEMLQYNNRNSLPQNDILNELYPLNFMQNLPQLYPIEVFPAFREYTMARHTGKDGKKFTYFDALNDHFLSTAYVNPSQFCLLGNYLAYYSPSSIRDRVAIVISDGRQLHAGATAVERAQQLVLRPTMHMPYTDIYNVGLFPKIVCDGRRHDFVKMQHIVLYMTWIQVCQLQNAVRSYDCSVTTDDAIKHLNEATLYAQPHTKWHVAQGDEGMKLVYQHVYLPRQRWLRGAVRAVVAGGVEAGAVYLKKFPDHVAFASWYRWQHNANITRPFEGDPLPAPP